MNPANYRVVRLPAPGHRLVNETLAGVVSRLVPLDADAINGVLDDLEACRDDVRSVVTP
jgi:hypothetical protein